MSILVSEKMLSWLSEQPHQPNAEEIAQKALQFSEQALSSVLDLVQEQLPEDCQPIRPTIAGLLFSVSELARKRHDAESGVDILQQTVKDLEEKYAEAIQEQESGV